MHVSWSPRGSAFCPGAVACLVALAAKGVTDGDYSRPETGAGIGVPSFFAPPTRRSGCVPEVTLPGVRVFGNWFADRSCYVVVMPWMPFSNEDFHVGDDFGLPQAARIPWEADRESFSVVYMRVASSFCIQANVDNNCPMVIRGKWSPA